MKRQAVAERAKVDSPGVVARLVGGGEEVEGLDERGVEGDNGEQGDRDERDERARRCGAVAHAHYAEIQLEKWTKCRRRGGMKMTFVSEVPAVLRFGIRDTGSSDRDGNLSRVSSVKLRWDRRQVSRRKTWCRMERDEMWPIRCRV